MKLDAIMSPTTGGTPPFADSREAREWLKLLPLINIQQSQLELTDALEQLNQSRIDAIELLKSLELLREAIYSTQEGLLKSYAGKPLPLLATEEQHWQAAQNLWLLTETAYTRCWKSILDGDTRLNEYHALIAERALRCACHTARGYLLIYRSIPQDVWRRLFDLYHLIEEAGFARLMVRDSLIEIHSTSMPQAMLIHALLLAAGGARQLTSKQLLWLDKRLEVLAARTSIAPHSQALPGKSCLQIDLDAPAPALRASRPLEGSTVREIDTLVLAQVLTKRIKLLREGELPQKMGLGTELGPQSAEALLTDIYRRWCELPTEIPFRGKVGVRPCLAGLGLINLHHLINDGKLPPIPEEKQGVNQRAMAELQLFGRTSASMREPVKKNGQHEQWQILRESSQDLLLSRSTERGQRIALQQLVGIGLLAGQYLLGVTRALEHSGSEMEIGVRLLPGVPEPVLARPIDLVRMGQNDFCEILRLPTVPALRASATLIIPTGWHRQGRVLDIWDGASLHRVRLLQVQERGADYERVMFALAGH